MHEPPGYLLRPAPLLKLDLHAVHLMRDEESATFLASLNEETDHASTSRGGDGTKSCWTCTEAFLLYAFGAEHYLTKHACCGRADLELQAPHARWNANEV